GSQARSSGALAQALLPAAMPDLARRKTVDPEECRRTHPSLSFLQFVRCKLQIQVKSSIVDLQGRLRISILRSRVCKSGIQRETCMPEFTVRTAEQLPTLLQAFRKQSNLTQADAAKRLGVSQQSFSQMERRADKVSADRLLEILSLLGVELVLRKPGVSPAPKPPAGPIW